MMKLYLKIFSLAFLSVLFFNNDLDAQGDLGIGEWSAHLPYNIGKTVTQSATRIYYGTESGILAILKEDSTQA